MAFRDQSGRGIEVKLYSGWEFICIVEDLITLKSTACFRVFVQAEDESIIYDKIVLMLCPD